MNHGGLTGQPVEQIDADPRAKKEIEELMVAIYGGPIPSGENPHMQDFWDCIASGKTPEANGLITRARRRVRHYPIACYNVCPYQEV